jgi:hypothetical protein
VKEREKKADNDKGEPMTTFAHMVVTMDTDTVDDQIRTLRCVAPVAKQIRPPNEEFALIPARGFKAKEWR